MESGEATVLSRNLARTGGRSDARYTQGTVWKLLLFTAIPMLPGTLSLAGYNIANTYYLSELGTDPLAVMGYVFPVTMLVASLFMGMAVGVATPMAQAIGRGDRALAVQIATAGVLLLTLVSVACGYLGIRFMNQTFSLYGAKPELLPLIAEYMEIWYAGCFTVALMMLGNHLLIGSGNPIYAGTLMLFGMTLNVLLDYWFIFGAGPIPAMGIRGAALGTVISQGAAAFLSLAVQQFHRHMISLPILRHWRQVLSAWRIILGMTMSLVIGYLLVPLGNNVILWVVSQFGKEAVAAVATVGRFETVALMIPMSLGMSLTSVVAQNFGAGCYERIRTAMKFSVSFVLVLEFGIAILAYLFAAPLTSIFTEDPEVARIMILHLQIVSFGYGMTELHRYSCFFLTGCSHPRLATWANVVRVGLLIGGAWYGAAWAGITGMFCARLGTDLLAGTLNILLAAWIVWRCGDPPTQILCPCGQQN